MDDICNNSYKCWECDKDCEVKKIFSLPDQAFYSFVNDSSKYTAGRMIASGMSYEKAEEQKTKWVLTLVTSRMKYLEERNK